MVPPLVVLAALAAVSACNRNNNVQTGVTGVDLTVRYDTGAGLMSLRVAGYLNSTPAFLPGVLPDSPRPLTRGTETVAILLPDVLAGRTLLIRVDGLAGDAVIASGLQPVVLELGRLVAAEVSLTSAATCGDSVVTPNVEQCDDGNVVSGDGCSADCLTEPAIVCGPTSCTGGCCLYGQCVSRALATCGTAGAECTVCDPKRADTCSEAGGCQCGGGPACVAGQLCTNGACVCDVKNCASGCCHDGACVASSVAACGVDGVRCSVCDVTKADRCDANGVCACGTGAACAGGQRCANGLCVCDKSSCPSGCCQGAVCAIRSLTSCGDAGSTCTMCDMRSDNCSADGSCRCGNGVSCAKGLRCIGGSCVCDGTSCGDGCCASGKCLPGDSADSCGAGGNSCDLCPPGQTCTDGHCSGCNTGTCAGCCSGASCNVPSLTTCGTGSATCMGCDAKRADGCSAAGVCSCGTGPMCAVGSRCQDGICMCKASSCPSGCCSNGACIPPAVNFCGSAGGACQECSLLSADNCTAAGACGCGAGPACAARQHCMSGSCVCDQTSCPNGCCDGNVCRAPGPTSCGAGGGVCRDCGIRADRCSQSGACRCGAGAPCDDGFRCLNGACVCDGTSCPNGCCSSTGCQPGTDPAVCGTGGAACGNCASGICTSGVCSDCTTTNCVDGCCSGSTCTRKKSLMACGANGAACVSCDPSRADTCSATGVCTCGGQPACGAGKRCVGGACACDSISCPGGCCANGACQPQSTSACGVAGGACVTCPAAAADSCDVVSGKCQCGNKAPCGPGTVCQGGSCTCNEVSCPTGCCANDGSCMSPPSIAACGILGETCVGCDTATADTCSPTGMCTCGANPPCAAGTRCVGSTCVVSEL